MRIDEDWMVFGQADFNLRENLAVDNNICSWIKILSY
ncbi:hypothetical protein SAMN03080594_1011220 [Arenibacter palladensis]|uniref:Uncharacterized protein n=1 Tax=Arenibacter palladensis TaxID=237373 RepID=A0A1M4W671_9FLAO|nr:hypothetical protein SAMN03080594_1011220 [Arenibacter palladensis]